MSVVVTCDAGIRVPGKYCGIPIYDRWDGCTLYSGIYVMYIAENVKEYLRPYAGKAIQIDAIDVFQPINPGDGLIGTHRYIGNAPMNRNWSKLSGIKLESSLKIQGDGKPIATITVRNKGKNTVGLFSQMLALTLLMKCDSSKPGPLVSNGTSFALITRQSFWVGESPRCEGKGVRGGIPYSWSLDKEQALPHKFSLDAGESKQIYIQLDLPNGEFDFLCGYGGGVHEGQCLASNLSAFDVEDDKAKIIEIKSR